MMSRLHHAPYSTLRIIELNTASLSLAVFLAVFFSSCSKDSSIIDSSAQDLPLSLKNLRLSAYAFDTDSISVTPGRDKKPEDPVTVSFHVSVQAAPVPGANPRSAQEVTCRVITDANAVEKTSAVLTGTGGQYTGDIALPIRRGDVGEYRVIVEGRDTQEIALNPVFTKIAVLNGNNPPSFCGLTAPDTVDLPTSGSTIIHLEICVSDRSGIEDVKRVFFNSYKPDGLGSNDNPIIMYDDGTHGDVIAKDGQFSRDVELPSTSQKGLYRFEFFAFDLGNLQSGVLIHNLVVQ